MPEYENICSVCFMNTKKTELINCKNNNCNIKYCNECYIAYLEHTFNENIKPLCINKECQIEYIYSDIKKIKNNELNEKYINTIIHILSNDKQDTINELEIRNSIKNKVEKKRAEHINTFPIAIQKMINIVYMEKLLKIQKNNNKLMNKHTSINNKIKCFNDICNGILDKDYTCILCDISYCKKCELEIKNSKHVCNKNNIKSLKLKNQMVKCPNCIIPVEKIEGCNDMTCPNCKVNFNYITGNITKSGNHSDLTLNLNLNNNKLSVLYENEYDKEVIDLLKTIEQYEPKKNSDTKLTKLLHKYKNEDNKIIISKKIIKEYEKFIKNKNYWKYINFINNYHKQKKLTTKILYNVINQL